MRTPPVEKPIRVKILGRDYALRVRAEDEAVTRRIAAYVDERMRMFQQAHPQQPEVTTAVIAALSIAEELFTAHDQHDRAAAALENELNALDLRLAAALPPEHEAENEETLD